MSARLVGLGLLGHVTDGGLVDGGLELLDDCAGDFSFDQVGGAVGPTFGAFPISTPEWVAAAVVLSRLGDAGVDGGADAGSSVEDDGGIGRRTQAVGCACASAFGVAVLALRRRQSPN
ncbi:MAG: hypothetical protein U0228_38015 [Myxococcaceae bacterium]